MLGGSYFYIQKSATINDADILENILQTDENFKHLITQDDNYDVAIFADRGFRDTVERGTLAKLEVHFLTPDLEFS